MSAKRNAADEDQIKDQSQKQKFRREREVNDIRSMLGTTEGRRFLWRLMEKCGVYRESFTGSSETFFLEGKRSIGLFVIAEIMDAEPEAYLLMIKENRKGDDDNV